MSAGGGRGALLLGIDEGTTAVKVALFDAGLRPLAAARRPVPVTHPRPGYVEQDPEEIVRAVVDAVAEALAGHDAGDVVAVGLDHQGESALAWEAGSTRPLSPVIVWQDKRQQELLEGIDASVVARSGLPLDPYFSAGKLAWMLAHEPAVQRAADAGTLRLGTVDAFLRERLGGAFVTDLSTASRTQLLALGGTDWDEQLLAAFGLRRDWLPALGATFGAELGELRCERWPAPLPLRAQLVDQQAALAGSGAVAPGSVKATYGTGVFVLARTEGPVRSESLLPTVAWRNPAGAVAYALDGGVFAAGALLDWLAQGLGLATDTAALADAAATVPDSAGVTLLPALAGLGAPWWEAQARAVLAGLHAGVRPAHVGRAALEAIAWRVADVIEALAELVPVERVHVDGGLTNNPTLLRLQADALGLPLRIGPADVTVLGAALLAGVGAGRFASVEEACARLPVGRVVAPALDRALRDEGRQRWRSFVRSAVALQAGGSEQPR